MQSKDIMNKIEEILSDVKIAILATIDAEEAPRLRWMSPVLLDSRPNVLYTISSPHFHKIHQLENNPQVEWMIQTLDVSEVVNVKGKINIIDNPALKAEVIEKMDDRLNVFWRLSSEETDFLVLETIIDEASYYLPMRPTKTTVRFAKKI